MKKLKTLFYYVLEIAALLAIYWFNNEAFSRVILFLVWIKIAIFTGVLFMLKDRQGFTITKGKRAISSNTMFLLSAVVSACMVLNSWWITAIANMVVFSLVNAESNEILKEWRKEHEQQT